MGAREWVAAGTVVESVVAVAAGAWAAAVVVVTVMAAVDVMIRAG